MMNIAEKLEFTADKPSIASILKSDKINIIAIGLLKGQELKKHLTGLPTTLTVIKGGLDFNLESEKVQLRTFDTYQIPINVEHFVIGNEEENIFTLTQER